MMNETRTITGVLLDMEAETAGRVTIPDTLPALYEALHCGLIEIVSRRIGGRRFTIVCDEEGLLQNAPRISAVDDLGGVMLVGSLLICGEGGDGELESLTEAEQLHVLRHIVPFGTRRHPIPYPILTRCNY